MRIKIMIMRLFILPVVLLLASILPVIVYRHSVTSGNDILVAFAGSLRLPAQVFSYGLFGAGVIAMFISIYSFFAWTKGEGELCIYCGGIVKYRATGKYSPHYRCLACGQNENAEKRHGGF